MPLGVLTKILSHLCVDGPLALRHLLFVSKGFYYTAINEASLWTTIPFDAEFIDHFRRRSDKQANSFIQQCLHRSNSRPLYIRILCHDVPGHERIAGSLQALNDPKYRGYQRCTSLILTSRGWGNLITQKILVLLPRELPSLQQLSLLSFVDPTDGPQFPDCPVLERVEMTGHFEPYPAFWRTNFAHVTTLSFGNNPITNWVDYDIATLSLFPVLRDLTLFTDDSRGPWEVKSQLKARFQYLQILRVVGRSQQGSSIR